MPSAHDSHPAPPGCSLKRPGSHAAHPCSSGVKPALHAQSLGATLASGESECDVQAWQSSGPLLTVPLYVPAPHAMQVT